MAAKDSKISLSLGTAQLGMHYGVSNSAGRPGPEQAATLLRGAVEAGLYSLDTAPAYGDSEQVIGAALPADAPIRIVTKSLAGGDPDETVRRFHRSLADLGRDSVHGLLVHDVADLQGPRGAELGRRLLALREQGLVGKLGVSVYEPAALDAARRALPVELVQLPLNVLDQRFLADHAIERLAADGVEVHVRSIFLQGLLLMEPSALPLGLARAEPHLHAFRQRCESAGVAPLAGALGFAAGVEGLRSVIVGINSPAELEGCLAATRELPELDYADLAVGDPAIIDPRTWPAG